MLFFLKKINLCIYHDQHERLCLYYGFFLCFLIAIEYSWVSLHYSFFFVLYSLINNLMENEDGYKLIARLLLCRKLRR